MVQATSIARGRRAGLKRLLAAAVAAASLAACSPPESAVQASWADDYRDRHPIRVVHDGQAYRAVTNECGTWVTDGRNTNSNRSPYEFGCAYQRNMAAMIADPQDLISPRPMDPPYANRRQTVIGAYGRGDDTASAGGDSATISGLGQ